MIPRQVFSQGQVLWHVLRVGEEFFESKMLNLSFKQRQVSHCLSANSSNKTAELEKHRTWKIKAIMTDADIENFYKLHPR